jgi:hypothetical protein
MSVCCMTKRQKYKIWRISDFYLIDRLLTEGKSLDIIANIIGITRNALYKALKRRKIYGQISGPAKSMEVCSVVDIYKIADNLSINRNIGAIGILQKINMSRRNTELPRLILC